MKFYNLIQFSLFFLFFNTIANATEQFSGCRVRSSISRCCTVDVTVDILEKQTEFGKKCLSQGKKVEEITYRSCDLNTEKHGQIQNQKLFWCTDTVSSTQPSTPQSIPETQQPQSQTGALAGTYTASIARDEGSQMKMRLVYAFFGDQKSVQDLKIQDKKFILQIGLEPYVELQDDEITAAQSLGFKKHSSSSRNIFSIPLSMIPNIFSPLTDPTNDPRQLIIRKILHRTQQSLLEMANELKNRDLVILRPLSEMNGMEDWAVSNSSKVNSYVAAWKSIVNFFNSQGLSNVKYSFNPLVYANDSVIQGRASPSNQNIKVALQKLIQGSRVDYIGLNVYLSRRSGLRVDLQGRHSMKNMVLPWMRYLQSVLPSSASIGWSIGEFGIASGSQGFSSTERNSWIQSAFSDLKALGFKYVVYFNDTDRWSVSGVQETERTLHESILKFQL